MKIISPDVRENGCSVGSPLLVMKIIISISLSVGQPLLDIETWIYKILKSYIEFLNSMLHKKHKILYNETSLSWICHGGCSHTVLLFIFCK